MMGISKWKATVQKEINREVFGADGLESLALSVVY